MRREYRLTNNASFNYIYKKGELISSQIVNIMYVRATSVKVGISVSKKIGNSVTRSLVKRRIKESFRLLIPQLTGKYNYVLVARPGIEKTDYTHIAGEIKRLLGKARHISNVESIS